MFDFKSQLKPKALKLFSFILAGTFLTLFLLELSLNIWLRASLQKSLTRDLRADTKIATSISWLGLNDFIHGRVDWVKIRGQNCRIGNLRYAGLRIDNRGFKCNLSKLMRRKELEFISLNRTIVEASINETALQDYVDLTYPGTGVTLRILPEKLRLAVEAEIWGSKVLAQLDGKLEIASPQSLRFYPERLMVAGRSAPRDFLKFIGNQIPFQFGVMERWPLRITGIELGSGMIHISFREAK